MQNLAEMDDLKYISQDRLSKTTNSFRIKCPSPGFKMGTAWQYSLHSSWENIYAFDGWQHLGH